MSDQESKVQKRRSVLFITYDGLLDPLGGSQILPYLYSIASHPRHVHVISFEKSARFLSGAERLRTELAEKRIGWTPLSFTSRGGKLGKAWDLFRMYRTALGLQLRHRFRIAHCRSYQAMQVGCFLHRWTGIKTIFDMRGLWVDDRVEGDLWPQEKWVYRQLYRYYKHIERRMLECADSVVVLTERVVPEIRSLAPGMKGGIAVIPCCADFDHFGGVEAQTRSAVREELGIGENALVFSYLGSLGTVYLLEDMLLLFKTAVRRREEPVHLLLITQDWSKAHESLLDRLDMRALRDRIHVRPASREEVPIVLGVSDVMMSFRRSTYSQQACSPTKLAEAFALGIPAISNAGVGDVDRLTCELDAGAVIELDHREGFDNIISKLDSILAKSGKELRERARQRLGLEVAKERYRQVYDGLEQSS